VPMAAVSTLNGRTRIQLTPDAVIATANVTPRNAAIEQVLELRRKEKGTTQESTVARRVLELPSSGEATNIELRDDTLAWEKTYEYRVAIVASVKVPNGETVTFDAALSPPQDLLAHDVFPPAVPSGLQAVFSGQLPGQKPAIDLTWNPDLDRDLAGYFVYRRRENEPVSAALKLNAQPVTAPAYRDIEVRPGDTYLYSVSAIDERGNQSKRSEETSESVPK
ncbi:MAG TPA: fibronectin type III domain-containing protein, partial [Terriglobales bacterium]|nr:fibronectin type III domain-containing protein [Terriglobales bacterium]